VPAWPGFPEPDAEPDPDPAPATPPLALPPAPESFPPASVDDVVCFVVGVVPVEPEVVGLVGGGGGAVVGVEAAVTTNVAGV
jgi:hypothetical protein